MNHDEAIRELEEARKAAQDRRSFERYQALLLWKKGYPETGIAEIIGRCPLTVSNYVDAYQKTGLTGFVLGFQPENRRNYLLNRDRFCWKQSRTRPRQM